MTAEPSVDRGADASAGDVGVLAALTGTKRALLEHSGRPDRLWQPGGLQLPDPFPMPRPEPGSPADPSTTDSTIETFLVTDPNQPAEAIGADQALAEWWQPTVDRFVATVLDAIDRLGVTVSWPASVDATTSTSAAVNGLAHFDDDGTGLDAKGLEAGVGLVATVASQHGSRVAVGQMPCRPVTPPAPMEVTDEAVVLFDGEPNGSLAPNSASTGLTGEDDQPPLEAVVIEADRIVLFPRFGQLHSGPEPASLTDDGVRSLLVLRADTVPATRP